MVVLGGGAVSYEQGTHAGQPALTRRAARWPRGSWHAEILPTSFERRESNNLKRIKEIYLKAKAKIWPSLSYTCRVLAWTVLCVALTVLSGIDCLICAECPAERWSNLRRRVEPRGGRVDLGPETLFVTRHKLSGLVDCSSSVAL